MKRFFIIALASLCCTSLSPAQNGGIDVTSQMRVFEGTYYDITCSEEELADETKRCAALLSKKPATASKKKKGSGSAEGNKPLVEWTADLMARRSLFGQQILSYLRDQDPSLLEPFRHRQPLYTTMFYAPLFRAVSLPGMVGAQDKPASGVSVGRVSIYRCLVKAPRAGLYRFVGAATDFMIVNISGKNVLETGEWIPTLMKKKDPRTASATLDSKHAIQIQKGTGKGAYADYEFISHFKEIPTWNRRIGGLTAGHTFSMGEGELCRMEVLIGSAGSEDYGFVLYVEDMNHKVEAGKPYALFRLNHNTPSVKDSHFWYKKSRSLRSCDEEGLEAPPFDTNNTELWQFYPLKS